MTGTVAGPSVWRQHTSLLRMEFILLRRNLAAAVLVLVLPLVFGVFRLGGDTVSAGDAPAAVARMASAFGMIAAVFLHHHLVTVYASRRQELMLKRLRAGLPADITILTGAASAATAVFLGQALVLALYAVIVLDVPAPLNPIPVLLALVLTAALMTTTAALVSALTRSSDAAMITTFPTVAFFLVTPGILVSQGVLPQAVEDVFWYTPLGPFREVMLTGWIGADGAHGFLGSLAAGLPGLGVMAAWLALTALAVQRYFHWEPRHGG